MDVVTTGTEKGLGPTSMFDYFQGSKTMPQNLFRGMLDACSTQTTRAKIVETSASLCVTGDLGWARMCQNEKVNVLSDEEARYRCLREFLCFEQRDMDLHNRGAQTARFRITAGYIIREHRLLSH